MRLNQILWANELLQTYVTYLHVDFFKINEVETSLQITNVGVACNQVLFLFRILQPHFGRISSFRIWMMLYQLGH